MLDLDFWPLLHKVTSKWVLYNLICLQYFAMKTQKRNAVILYLRATRHFQKVISV